jgi:hypothetical protein
VPQTIQRSFTSGELAPALRSRADLAKYASGLALCQNFIVRPQGGVYSRPGTRYVGDLDDMTQRARLLPFSFNTEQTYVLVFEHLKMRVIKNGGLVVSAAKTITGATQANPVEITATAHGYTTGDTVDINAIVGMTELNGNLFQITSTGANTFTLDGIDGTGYTAYTSGGTSEKVFELVTPYTAAQLSRLSYTQSADVMTICHPSHDPANLGRTAHDAWTLTDIDYTAQIASPLFAGAKTYTITNITATNPVTVSISFNGAPAGFYWFLLPRPVNPDNQVIISGVGGMTEVNDEVFDVGAITAYDQIAGTETFELKGVDGTAFTAYTSGGTNTMGGGGVTNVGDPAGGGTYFKKYRYVVTSVDADGVESLPSSSTAINCKSLSTTYGVKLDWANVTGADHYRIYKDPSNDTAIYGWIGDSKNSNFIDYNKAPVTSDAPPAARDPFSAVDDKPAVVNYYQQRQVFANTNNEPQTVFTSQVGIYDSMRTSEPLRDDDAVTFTIAGKEVNEIRHILGLDSMVLLTSGAEWLTTEGQDQVFTPATVGVRVQSYNGASWVTPVIVNSTALYVQEKGTKVRDLGYEFSNDKYTGNDLSIMSEHLFEGLQIEEMTFAAEPYGIVWCVRSDGVLLGLTYQREHQVWGWHQHITDGIVESVTVISEDNRDALYLSIQRTIDGNTVRYVERMEPRETTLSEDAFYVDSGLTYDGASATVISGLDHLEGEAVAVLADGNVVKDLTVASGSITLPRAATKVQVGLAYTPAIELLDIDTPGDGTLKGKEISISKVVIEFEKSRGGWVGPKLDDNSTGEMYEIKPRFQSDSYDSIELKTNKQEIYIEPVWSLGGGIRIEQRDPLPMSILSVIPEVDVGGS